MTETIKGQTAGQTKSKPAKRGKPPKRARGAPNTSDTADARWTVRGVPINVRTMAVNGAKDRNMTVGDWLAELIVLNRKPHTADEKTNLPAMPIPDLIDLVKVMDERLTAMEVKQKRPIFSKLFGGHNGRQTAPH